jgi:hypothetical protein
VTASAEAISLYQSYISACVDMAAGAGAPSSSAIYLSGDRGRSEWGSDGASGLGFDAGCRGACPPPPQSRSLPAVAAAVPYLTSSAAGGLQRTARHVLGGTLPIQPEPYTLHPIPYTLYPTPYTLHPTRTPYTPHPTPYTPHPTPYTLNP